MILDLMIWIEFCEIFKAEYTDCKRIKCLTTDTSNALHQTCHGLVELAKFLLSNDSHSYVLLGKFTTVPIEQAFGKLREGSGGTYFINTQQVIEKWNISKMSPGRNNLFVESRVFDLRSMYFEINDLRKHCFPARKRYDLCQNQVNMRQNRPPHLSGDCTMKRPVIKVRPGHDTNTVI